MDGALCQFKFLVAVIAHIMVCIWDMAPCRYVTGYQNYGDMQTPRESSRRTVLGSFA